MTTVRKAPLNSSNFVNYGTPKILKNFEDKPVDPVTAEPTAESRSAIDFGKRDTSGLNFGFPEPTRATATSTDKTEPAASPVGEDASMPPEERRAQRRQEWKSAADVQRRAMQMQKDAEEKLKQAKQMSDLLEQARKNPTAVAKALNMDPTEFLRQYQNEMFNIPNDVPPRPEEEVKARLDRYDQERARERQQFAELQSLTVKQNYISSKIMPVIIADKDKFEILNSDDPNTAAAFIYDMMNEHYSKTGEELQASDVAEEMENILAKEMEERLAPTRRLKKFSKYFTEQPAEPAQLGDDLDHRETTASSQLGGKSGELVMDNSRNTREYQGPARKQYETFNGIGSNGTTGPNTSQRNSTWTSKREQKLQQVARKVLGG